MLGRQTPGGDGFVGAVKIEQSELPQARRDQHVGRLAGQSRTRDASLHDGNAVGHNVGQRRPYHVLAVALAPSAELRLETCQQGRSFLEAVRAAWPAPRLDACALEGEVAYPVAVGLACAAHGLAKGPALGAFVLALVQTLVSAGLRLAPVGQTAGTRIVARLAPLADGLAQAALTSSLDDIGSSTFRADVGSMRHETQYTRLFRS